MSRKGYEPVIISADAENLDWEAKQYNALMPLANDFFDAVRNKLVLNGAESIRESVGYFKDNFEKDITDILEGISKKED